jgi:hypothetical protein
MINRLSVASDVDVTRQVIFNIISSAWCSAYLARILIPVVMTIIIILISCSSSVALSAAAADDDDADINTMSIMKSVNENTNAKSTVQITTVSSSNNITNDSTSVRQPTSSTLPPISNKTLSVFGNMDLTNSSIRLEPFMILPGSKYTTRPENSSFTINLLDGEGKILARYPFSPKISTSLPEDNHNVMALLSEALPYNLSTKQIVISKDGKELASRNVSTHAPQVQLIFPNGGERFKDKFTIRWQGSDLDGDHLTYSLLYSADNGYTWQAIARNINESQLTTNVNELPGSTKALFRVVATDGVNTAIDDSDHTFIILPSRSTH